MSLPDGVAVLISWLTPLGDTRSDRPNGAPLPFRQVRRIGGTDDGLADHPLIAVHTITATEAEANTEGMRTHERIMALIGRFAGPQWVETSTGRWYVDGGEARDRKVIRWADDGTEWACVGVYKVDVRRQP